jgi:hypothetical protein
VYDLAAAEELAGLMERAKKDFAEFETKSLAESVKKDNSNRELIFYYADHAHDPAKAPEDRRAGIRMAARRFHAGCICLGIACERP